MGAKPLRKPERERRPQAEAQRPVDVSQNLAYRLVVLTNSLTRSAGRDFAQAAGLTVPEWRVLSVVGSKAPISLAELTQILAVDKGWVSRTVAQLEARGLLARTPHAKHERQFELQLTREGARMHLKGSDISLARQKVLESAFSKAELAALYEALARLQTLAETLEAGVGIDA